ncbi:fla cluster protein FlaCE [Haloferax gibbonsii ATCC 33959]|uniref:Fla cluster protein FlaCE n=2 Tax=Haloferax gibbonsii TaxID=35746 RepID=M0H2G2_HALGM|nr:fla cluster protein FlaCE [Haloferax gibbonsii ATCC 33959]
MMEWQNDEDTADAGDETETEEQHMSSDDGLGFEEGIDDLSDEFGDFGDDLDDGFDDDDFGGFDDDNSEELAELEDRVGELENEVSAISSGMNTVREENKQIGETVEELDDTIRKLLDIYEMVTRGINPFVDDAREMGGLDGGGAFGLFEAEAEDEEHLDPEVANADAESFFDDDFGELDAEEGAKEAELAAEDELAEAERESPADALDDGDEEADEADDSGAAGGASFDDLKEQYEEGGGWDEEDEAEANEAEADEMEADDAETDLADAAVDLEDGFEDEPVGGIEDEFEAVADETDDPSDEPSEPEHEPEVEDADGDVRKTLDELEAEYATAAMAKDELSDDDEDDAAAEPEPSAAVEESDAYLAALPSNYVSEVLVLEWVEHLVAVGGALGASRALRQYREQDWISRAVESELNAHVGQIAPSVADADGGELRIDDHQTSLAYVCRLAEDVPRGQLYEELVAYGRRFDGIRC